MKIHFSLGWYEKRGKAGFKFSAYESLFDEYMKRISRFSPCEAGKIPLHKPAGSVLWMCHTSPKAKSISSENLAALLQKTLNSGAKELCIAIGSADGFTDKNVQEMNPDFLWSFGPATYPHELAAVVAAEQLYRAHAILHRLPYHFGHC